ncbi:SOS response-associated peptidase [Patescibacteria group bacterium]|nr:SOS response-associated peptidase [Patescibacteria group bacterium]MBU4512417.1 SOS response-associated peptidase [Patescibacteria group bacterium]MCG2693267.1 SOS response-associated peptidase [Candidatus Parcubacteria bacterium]
MCGRFVVYNLREHFQIDQTSVHVQPNYNVAPSQEIPLILKEDSKSHLENFHWGLVPFWAKDKSIGNRLINARRETVAEKPAFRAAFKKRRCLIPANGFYEWREKDGKKQPYYITLPSDDPFAFAGLWETWDKEDPPYKSCLLITTAAAESVQPIHNRMPVILKPEYYEKWLDPDAKDPKEILSGGMFTEFKFYPVSKRVNSAVWNEPGCIARVGVGVGVGGGIGGMFY